MIFTIDFNGGGDVDSALNKSAMIICVVAIGLTVRPFHTEDGGVIDCPGARFIALQLSAVVINIFGMYELFQRHTDIAQYCHRDVFRDNKTVKCAVS